MAGGRILLIQPWPLPGPVPSLRGPAVWSLPSRALALGGQVRMLVGEPSAAGGVDWGESPALGGVVGGQAGVGRWGAKITWVQRSWNHMLSKTHEKQPDRRVQKLGC